MMGRYVVDGAPTSTDFYYTKVAFGLSELDATLATE